MDTAQGGTLRPASPEPDTATQHHHQQQTHDDIPTHDDSLAPNSGTPPADPAHHLPAALSSIDLALSDEPEHPVPATVTSPEEETLESRPSPTAETADTTSGEHVTSATGTSGDGEPETAEPSLNHEHISPPHSPTEDAPSREPTTHQAALGLSVTSANDDETNSLSASDSEELDESDSDSDSISDDDEDDRLPATPHERRLTLLEALNETRESANHYTSSPTPDQINTQPRRSAAPVDDSPPLPASPPPPPPPHTRPPANRSASEFILPRWQPDAEVTLCPICSTQFGIFVRKHHCRKCGRVVCNACSPHRIVIPYQYIVRPPGEYPFPPYPQNGEEGRIADFSSISGGERVRLCNPCVPDPNMTPPQAQGFPGSTSPRPPHQRSHSSSNPHTGIESSSSQYQSYPISPRAEAHARNRSITMNSGAGPSGQSGYYSRSARTAGERPMYYSASYSASSADPRQSSRRQNRDSVGLQSAINRPLPPAPQIPEEDECPVCHLELPSRDLPDAEARREAHINDCITYHSAYNPRRATLMASAGEHGTPPQRTERRTGMFPYVATEKDCVDDAECTICFEEYEAGDHMCRLECLCRFHRICIAAWFENHPGRCPVHQHDSYGY